MNKILKTVIVLIAMLSHPLIHAQSTPPPPPGGGPPGFPIPGILIALVAAMSYGVYKKYNNSKKIKPYEH